MSETKHATYGPSSLKFRKICPGWRNDRDADLTAANEGTKLHSAYETGILLGLDDEQATAVKKVIRYTETFEKLPGAVVFKEMRLSINDGLTFGTADRVIIVGRGAYLLDGKFGRGAIDDAEINLQGWAYVIGIFERFDVDWVSVHFISPRRDEVTTHKFSREDLPRIATEVNMVIQRCKDFDESAVRDSRGNIIACDASMLNRHDQACQYCGLIARCPKHTDYAIAVAKKYAPLELVEEVHSSEISDPAVMAQAYAAARVMEKWAASVKKHATEMAMNGIELPGWEIRERAGNRSITNPVIAYPILLEAGLEPIEIASASSISLGAVEKLVNDKAPRGKKAKIVAELNAKLAANEAVTAGEGIKYLKRVSGE